jgi:hypothetical protein
MNKKFVSLALASSMLFTTGAVYAKARQSAAWRVT